MYSLLVESSLRCLSIPYGLLTRGHPTEYKEQLSLQRIGETRRDGRAVCKCSLESIGEMKRQLASRRKEQRGERRTEILGLDLR